MNPTERTSQNTFFNCFPPIETRCKKITLIALGVLAVGGAAVCLSALLGYLPILAGYIGGGVSAASILSMVLVAICSRRSDDDRYEGMLSGSRGRSGHRFSSSSSSSSPDFRKLPLSIPVTKDDNAYKSMEQLVEEGKTEEAWQLYVKTSRKEVRGKESLFIERKLSLGNWVHLPPEKLLNAIINHWLSSGEKIDKWISADFIRDCAQVYSDFRTKCLEEDRLWSCFSGYEAYLCDIAQTHPDFGFQIMVSKRGEGVLNDNNRMEIFQASYTKILEAIKGNTLNKENIQSLAHFLISYRIVIGREDFKKVQLITSFLRKAQKAYKVESETYKNYSLYISAMDLVEGKLALQGIYSGKVEKTSFPPVETDILLTDVFHTEWVQEVSRKIAVATEEESVRKGMFYLSLIPKSSDSYIDAQFMLGNIWFDLDCFSEAGEIYLKIAQLENEHASEALLLATMSLLALQKEDEDWVYIAREDMEQRTTQGKEVRTLNPNECKSMTLEELIKTQKELK